jgi:uncharacterized membrane protein YedE/YeeE
MKQFLALLFGCIFGGGLQVSGMTNPAKVLAFLDVMGSWDPTLAFVMGAALVVSATGFLLVRAREESWLGESFAIPTSTDLDASLLAGAALFGIGWGLVGLCPGPALANLYRGSFESTVFVVAMIAGVVGFQFFTRNSRRQD